MVLLNYLLALLMLALLPVAWWLIRQAGRPA